MSKPNEVKRHPAAIALEKWLESQDGIECCNAKTLHCPQNVYYLRNRLMRAWQAGWDAAEALDGKAKTP